MLDIKPIIRTKRGVFEILSIDRVRNQFMVRTIDGKHYGYIARNEVIK